MQKNTLTIEIPCDALAVEIKQEVNRLLQSMERVSNDGHRKRGLALASNSIRLNGGR